jgi:hypothetical protein
MRLATGVGFVAALAVQLIGCKSSDPPAGAAADASPASVASSDPSATRKVTKEDCEGWAERAANILVASFNDAARSCPPQVRENVGRKFEGNKVSIRNGAYDLCEKHLRETYAVKDAACVMRAADAKALAACKFAPLTNEGDSNWVGMVDDLRSKCAQAAAAGSAGGSATPPL